MVIYLELTLINQIFLLLIKAFYFHFFQIKFNYFDLKEVTFRIYTNNIIIVN